MANAEILSIGTELLLGEVLDTNSKYFATELAKLGIDCYYRVTVGDNKDRIKASLKQAFDRSDIVLTSGGLGPTADDLTTECIAEFFNLPMIMDEKVLEEIEKLFAERNLSMPETNRKQAMRPQGSGVLPNPSGTAPGIMWVIPEDVLKSAGVAEPTRKRAILTFPGVPSELVNMWNQSGADFIAKNFLTGAIFSIELKHYGIGESALAEKYADLLNGTSPTVAPYAGMGECRLRVAAKASTAEEARALVMPIAELIRAESGKLCYGQDEDTLEAVVGQLLTQNNLTLSVAESCTGGLVSKRLTDIGGSSEYIKLNAVTYANEAKMQLLGVSKELLDQYGAVSDECARAMAEGIVKLSGADIGLSITGIAGPTGGTPDKPVGTVYLGLCANGQVDTKKLSLGTKLNRQEIRFRTSSAALNMVRLHLLTRNLITK
ncbi:MAG: competence/damage-inducible protein A [Candidatus Melainabacteria bacterium]|nr:MAG: competence/damage-inducible protein A [Candidatus Melainabacteria bacterium]